MRTKENKKIFNTNNRTKKNTMIFISGISIVIVAAKIYFYNYNLIDFSQLSDNINRISVLLLAVILIPFGMCIAISALNLHNDIVRNLLLLILGALIYAVFREKPLRIAFGIILILIFCFIIIKIFGKVISTFLTLGLLSILLVIFLMIMCYVEPNIPVTTVLYVSITLMLLIYNIFGVKLNQFCIKNILGESKEKIEQYDYEELRNQINLVYLILFFVLNVFYIFNNESITSTLANCVNNSLITGVCITNVNWKSLLWKNKA